MQTILKRVHLRRFKGEQDYLWILCLKFRLYKIDFLPNIFLIRQRNVWHEVKDVKNFCMV